MVFRHCARFGSPDGLCSIYFARFSSPDGWYCYILQGLAVLMMVLLHFAEFGSLDGWFASFGSVQQS